MDVIHARRGQLHRLCATRRIESAVTAAKAGDLGHAITVVQFEDKRTDDVVESRTQTATGDDARARLFCVEE